MRSIYLLSIFAFCYSVSEAQTITISGQCITNTITLTKLPNDNGKVAYGGTGTVLSTPNTPVTISWLPAPDLVWVVSMDGGPVFMNACNTSAPPKTGIASCEWMPVEGSPCSGGAPLVIDGTGALPVKLISFTGTATLTAVQLNWKTAMELNNKGFEVQRSSEGNSWTKIAFVTGAGNSNIERAYSFTDASPLGGQNYYRLVQLDLDEKQSISSVVSIDFGSASDYALKTNTGTGIYQVMINSKENIDLSILDFTGRKVWNKKAGQGLQQLDISNYPAGIYVLQVKRPGKVTTEKLIKK